MTTREFFIETLKEEAPRFERVFKALPHDKLDWRPHPKSKGAKELVASMIGEFTSIPTILKTGGIDFEKTSMPEIKSIDEAVDVLTKIANEGAVLTESMSDSDWDAKAVMSSGDKIEWEAPKGVMVWGIFFDLVHHRGQLSVYIRPMGGKVPAIYGPSGDMPD